MVVYGARFPLFGMSTKRSAASTDGDRSGDATSSLPSLASGDIPGMRTRSRACGAALWRATPSMCSCSVEGSLRVLLPTDDILQFDFTS